MRIIFRSTEKEGIVKRDTIVMVIVSGVMVMGLLGLMVFSPFASLFKDDGKVTPDANIGCEIDSLLAQKDYQGALSLLDAMIAMEEEDLPRYSFFDRYLSEKEQYKAQEARYTIYNLQWKRIEVLVGKNDRDALCSALKEYSSVIGYNQDKAKDLLKEIESEEK